MLVCASGLSYDEATTSIGCSVGTVKSRLWRARQHMQELVLGTTAPGVRGPEGRTLPSRRGARFRPVAPQDDLDLEGEMAFAGHFPLFPLQNRVPPLDKFQSGTA